MTTELLNSYLKLHFFIKIIDIFYYHVPIDLLEANQHKINWNQLSRNSNEIHLLKDNLDTGMKLEEYLQ